MNKSATSAPQAGSAVRGKLVVMGVVLLALAAASIGLAWRISRDRRSLEFWGPDAIRVIQKAKKVELLGVHSDEMLNISNDDPNTLEYGGQGIAVVEHRDISQAPGLIHHRHFLTDHVSFEWNTVGQPSKQNWKHALRFVDGNNQVLILLDLQNRRLANYNGGREVTFIPKISETWQTFINKQPTEAKK